MADFFSSFFIRNGSGKPKKKRIKADPGPKHCFLQPYVLVNNNNNTLPVYDWMVQGASTPRQGRLHVYQEGAGAPHHCYPLGSRAPAEYKRWTQNKSDITYDVS